MNPTFSQASVTKAQSNVLVRSGSVNFASFGVLGGSLKRTVDVLLSGFGLIILFPAFVIIGLAVKICDGGPILFKHQRIGYAGRSFGCLKFRTMCVDAEPQLNEYLLKCPAAATEWQMSQKLKYDPRLTRIGAVLRRSSLDELPQLVNVLRGEMSLVGPRPVVAEELARYQDYMQFYLSARPGMTGAWQISGRSDVSYAERVAMDVNYCRYWSLVTDLAILFRTLPALISRHGSY